MRLLIIHPKGGVGRTTTALYLGYELARRGKRVVLEDLDQARHLSRIYQPCPGLQLGGAGPRDYTIIDTAPEARDARAVALLRAADWALVPVKGPEPVSVQAIPLLLDWVRAAQGARLLGFVPTMYKSRSQTCQQWLAELERLAAAEGVPVFSPIKDQEALRALRPDGHAYGPLAEEVLRATGG